VDLASSKKGAFVCSLEQGKETSNSVKGLKYVDYLNDYITDKVLRNYLI
jgi:hypothetical protein